MSGTNEVTRIMHLMPTDKLYIDIESSGGCPAVRDQLFTIQELYDMRDEVEAFGVKDSFGRVSKFVFDGDKEEHTAYVVKSMSGNAHVVAGPNTINFKHMNTHLVEQKTVAELSNMEFEGIFPHLLMPKKRTYLKDYDFFLANLNNEVGYTIDLPDFEQMNMRLEQLSHAGVTCRPHPNMPKIHVGETQPICWLMKLLINGLADEYERCEEMLNDLVARGIVKPYLPWIPAQAERIYQDQCIYEGGTLNNYMPILRPVETSETCEAYKIMFIEGDAIDVQTTWYCA